MPKPQLTRIVLQPNVIFQKINQEAVLLDMASEQYYALNELGLRLWELFSEEENLDRVVSLILNEYDIEEKDLRRDVHNWIEEMQAFGLITLEADEG